MLIQDAVTSADETAFDYAFSLPNAFANSPGTAANGADACPFPRSGAVSDHGSEYATNYRAGDCPSARLLRDRYFISIDFALRQIRIVLCEHYALAIYDWIVTGNVFDTATGGNENNTECREDYSRHLQAL